MYSSPPPLKCSSPARYTFVSSAKSVRLQHKMCSSLAINAFAVRHRIRRWVAETLSSLMINAFVCSVISRWYAFYLVQNPPALKKKQTDSRERSFYKTSFQVGMDQYRNKAGMRKLKNTTLLRAGSTIVHFTVWVTKWIMDAGALRWRAETTSPLFCNIMGRCFCMSFLIAALPCFCPVYRSIPTWNLVSQKPFPDFML